MEPTCFYFPPWGFTVRFMVSDVTVRHSRSLALMANPARHLLRNPRWRPSSAPILFTLQRLSRYSPSLPRARLPPPLPLATLLYCRFYFESVTVDWGSLAPLAVLLSLSAQVSNIVVVGRGTAAAVAHCDGRICDALLQASARTLSARGSPPQGFSPL